MTATGPAIDERPAAGPTRALALVLPGGKADSLDPTDPRALTALRMRPFAAALHRAGARAGLAVWQVRYRFRGWNGTHAHPLTDVRWALAQARERFGEVPVVLVGHSMGGRAALRAGDAPGVAGVVALAPWLSREDPAEHLAGRRLLIAHGTLDVVTSRRASLRWAQRAAAGGVRVTYLRLLGDAHAMLLRPRRWHRIATAGALAYLGLAEPPGWLAGRRGGNGKNPDVRCM